jgi:hypothetical protein
MQAKARPSRTNGNGENGAVSKLARQFAAACKLVAGGLLVLDLNGLHVANSAAHRSGTIERHLPDISSHLTEGSTAAENVAFRQNDVGDLRFTDARCVLGNGIEHWPHVIRRIRDHAQNFADRGLLLERLAQFGRALLDLLFQVRILGLQLAGRA